MAIRPQPYRLKWPLTPTQVEGIDEMLQILFKKVREIEADVDAVPPSTGGSSSSTGSTSVGAFGLGMFDIGDGVEETDWLSLRSDLTGFVPYVGATQNVDLDGKNLSTTGRIFTPIMTGGTATTSTLSLRSTSGVGTTGADIIFGVGTDGSTEAIRILNNRRVGIGIAAPARPFHVHNPDATNIYSQWTHSSSGTTATDGLLLGIDTSAAYILAYENVPVEIYTNNVLRATFSNTLLNLTVALQVIGNSRFTTNVDGASLLAFTNAGASSKTWVFYPQGADLRLFEFNSGTGGAGNDRITFEAGGNIGIGTTNPSAVLHIKAGTATAGSAPVKFTSGTLLTTAEAGAVEFLTDAYYGTITTGATRKTFAFLESPSFTTPTLGTASATSLISTGSANNRAVINKILFGATTDAATAVELTTDGAAGSGSTNRIAVPSNAALSVVLNICVKQTGSANSKQMLRQFLITNNAGTTTIEGTVTTLGTDVGSAGLVTVTTTITANDTDDCIKIEVNGVAATNLRYTAYVVSTETIYA